MRVRAMSVSPLIVRQGTTPGSFLPTDLANLVAWYDASKITGLADGAAVATWTDSSGNGNHLTQGTAGFRPIYKVSILNGLPVVRFDGADDRLRNSSFPDFSDTHTTFVVAKLDGTGGSANQGLLEASNSVTNRGWLFFQEIATVTFAYRTIDAAGQRTIQSGSDFRDDVWRIHTGLTDAGNGAEYWTNGASEGTSAYTTPNPNTLTQLDVGRLAAVAYFFKGDVAEIIVYSSALTTAQIDQVEAYLASKYAITLS